MPFICATGAANLTNAVGYGGTEVLLPLDRPVGKSLIAAVGRLSNQVEGADDGEPEQ